VVIVTVLAQLILDALAYVYHGMFSFVKNGEEVDTIAITLAPL